MELITKKQIVGMFYEELAKVEKDISWIDKCSMYVESSEDSEEYAWLGMPPAFRKWHGNRNVVEPAEFGQTIINDPYEATINIKEKDLRQDKTGQLRIRLGELVDRSYYHWDSLLTTLIIAGEASTCYDGQYFFDDDHSEGSSGTQDNDLTGAAATGTNPTVTEFRNALFTCITQMLAFKDDQGEIISRGARKFLAIVPPIFYQAAVEAVSFSGSTAGFSSPLFKMMDQDSMEINISMNPGVASDWTDTFVVFRTDGRAKPLIRQEELKPRLSMKWLGSEYHHDTGRVEIGVDSNRAVGYGLWQQACLYVFT